MKKILTISAFSILLTIVLAISASARTVTYGDVNEDGKVTLSDGMMICSHIAGKATLSSDQIKIADFDGDGSISLAETLNLFKYVIGQITEVPIITIEDDVQESDYVKFMKKLYPDYQESPVGLDITFKDDLVSICYSTWHDYAKAYNNNAIYNIPEILAGNGSWGPENSFHYWSKPALGYYASTDTSVIRTHMTQLAEAGVDFIIIDNTNTLMDWQNATIGNSGKTAWELAIQEPTTALLETCLQMRQEGLQTPYIVFWNRNNEGWNVSSAIYSTYLSNERYADLFVYMRHDKYETAKPFIIGTDSTVGADYPNKFSTRNFTYRTMWGLLEDNNWSFLDHDNNPRIPIVDNDTGKTYYEQIVVCAAAQRNWMSNTSTALSRQHGLTFYNQWVNAFKARPKVVTLTWWNEWQSQRLKVGNGYQFTDLYNQEYSRDLEPMEGGFGDQYYQWMKQYIKAYKNHEACPKLVEN